MRRRRDQSIRRTEIRQERDRVQEEELGHIKEITQLKAALAKTNRLYKQAVSINADKLEQMLNTAGHKENEQLKADLVVLEKDKERLDWLEIYLKEAQGLPHWTGITVRIGEVCADSGSVTIRQAIDKARHNG